MTDPKINIYKARRKIGVVFQHFNLFPHLSVIRNVTIGCTEVLKIPKEEAEKIAIKYLNRVGLSDKRCISFGNIGRPKAAV